MLSGQVLWVWAASPTQSPGSIFVVPEAQSKTQIPRWRRFTICRQRLWRGKLPTMRMKPITMRKALYHLQCTWVCYYLILKASCKGTGTTIPYPSYVWWEDLPRTPEHVYKCLTEYLQQSVKYVCAHFVYQTVEHKQVGDLPKVTQRISDRAKTWTSIWFQHQSHHISDGLFVSIKVN